MKRDAVTVPLTESEELVITTDSSGGIGLKKDDRVQADYSVVGYFSFRVAVMECMAFGGQPFSVIIQNFSGDETWNPYISGIHKAIAELEMETLQITGSTESNFELQQSCMGLTVLGKRSRMNNEGHFEEDSHLCYAVIGYPLVGIEVMERSMEIAPLYLFKWCVSSQYIQDVIPVGSKGILYELSVITRKNISVENIQCKLDVLKSSGPSTCFIISYREHEKDHLIQQLGDYMHSLSYH